MMAEALHFTERMSARMNPSDSSTECGSRLTASEPPYSCDQPSSVKDCRRVAQRNLTLHGIILQMEKPAAERLRLIGDGLRLCGDALLIMLGLHAAFLQEWLFAVLLTPLGIVHGAKVLAQRQVLAGQWAQRVLLGHDLLMTALGTVVIAQAIVKYFPYDWVSSAWLQFRQYAGLAASLIATGVLMTSGYGLYMLKSRQPLNYSRLEFATAVFTCFVAVSKARAKIGFEEMAAIAAAVYLVVRSFDNRNAALLVKAEGLQSAAK